MASLDYKYIAQVVRQAQNGDSNAFAELYAATYQNQYLYAYSYLRDSFLAQDALQETYILALRNLTKLRDPTLVVAWLNQINFRVCYRMQKQEARYRTETLELFEDEPAPPSADPENQVIEIDTKQYLMRQVLDLPFTESQAILLRYYRNMKIDEIAKLMDLSRSTIKRSISSGLKRLQRAMNSGKGAAEL